MGYFPASWYISRGDQEEHEYENSPGDGFPENKVFFHDPKLTNQKTPANMAGLYIHIPFCRNACHYCDFHFSVALVYISPMLNAIQQEIASRREFLAGEVLDTVYLGGGTPSLLSTDQLDTLFGVIRDHYQISKDPEITLEVNPEDMNQDYMDGLLNVGVNRLSIGIQSFHDENLKFMNRRHGKSQSYRCLDIASKAGFRNVNIDLIYGVPGLTIEKWAENLDISTDFSPAHIAAYHLTYESGTVLDYRRKKRRFNVQNEQQSLEQYLMLVEKLEKTGYEHYEISNFAKAGFISKHNSAYWTGKKYLGAGPSAHSYDGKVRRWNIARNASYINRIKQGAVYHEQEILDEKAHFHDYLITRLRTKWGIDLDCIEHTFGQAFASHCLQKAKPFLQSGRLSKDGPKLFLSRDGMFIADHIATVLFMEPE
jgi:oxygen-independent coproporphyrinogen-3 oxidase